MLNLRCFYDSCFSNKLVKNKYGVSVYQELGMSKWASKDSLWGESNRASIAECLCYFMILSWTVLSYYLKYISILFCTYIYIYVYIHRIFCSNGCKRCSHVVMQSWLQSFDHPVMWVILPVPNGIEGTRLHRYS